MNNTVKKALAMMPDTVIKKGKVTTYMIEGPSFSAALVRENDNTGLKITRSQQAVYLLQHEYKCLSTCEEMKVIYMTRANTVISVATVGKGSKFATVSDVQAIAVGALLCGAQAVILAHNHPSDTAKPSTADISLTNKISEALKLLDIKTLDHIILTPSGGYFSFSDEGVTI